MATFRLLVAAILLPLAAGFTTQRMALMHPPRSASLLILNEIDVDKVTSAVTVPGEKPTRGPAPVPIKKAAPPPPEPELKVELPPKEEAAPPAPAPAAPKEVATAPEPFAAVTSLDLDLPLLPIGGLLAAAAVGTFVMRGGKDEREAAQEAAPAPAATKAAPAPAPAATKAAPAPAPASDDVDLSIPYDAAARLAYDEWRSKYNKGAFDESKYATFKANYEKMAVKNVVAKKNARVDGTEAEEVSLGENGDQAGVV